MTLSRLARERLGRKKPVAGLLDHPAGLSANPTVLVMVCVLFTLLAIYATGFCTSLGLLFQQLPIWLRLADQHTAGSLAYVGTIQVEPGATRQHLHIVLP